jgi:hypothetical protein
MTTKDISQYASVSDSKSLTQIDGKSFTIVAVEDSNYEDEGKTTEGVKLTTSESFDVDGESFNKFHTTRIAVVNKLKLKTLRDDLNLGHKIGPVVCKMVEPKKGKKPYYDLVKA